MLLEDLHSVSDPQIVGSFQGQFVVAGSGLVGLCSLPPSDLMATLAYTHEHNLSSAHLSLVDSYSLYDQSLPTEVFSQEVSSTRPIPRNISEALSPAFVEEYGPAIDKENAGFTTHECFAAVPLPQELGVFRLSGCLPASVMAQPKPGWWSVGIARFLGRITLNTRIIVLSFPVVTIVSYCPWLLLRTGNCFRRILFRLFSMGNLMMWTYTSNLLLDLRVQQAMCLNFARPCMVFIRLL